MCCVAVTLASQSDDDSGLVDIVMGAVGFLFAFVIGTAIPVLTSVDHTILMTGGLCTLLVVVLVANFMPSKKCVAHVCAVCCPHWQCELGCAP